ncbi:PadR family transcriptional regulator [Fredinandcohnia humi]
MSLSYAILGLLSYEDMTGYDIKSSFDNSIQCIWPAHLSQIYRDLGSLESKGWVHSRIETQETRPDRKVYSISDQGKKELLQWLHKMPKNFDSVVRDEMALRTFFGSKIDKEDLILQLKMLINEKRETLLFLEETSEKIKNTPYDSEKMYWLFSLRKGYKIAEAELEWAEECIKELKNK